MDPTLGFTRGVYAAVCAGVNEDNMNFRIGIAHLLIDTYCVWAQSVREFEKRATPEIPEQDLNSPRSPL